MKRTLKITAVLLVIVMLSPLMVAFARPVCPIERQMAQIYAQAVADVTDEQIAEIAALREAEEEFLANLTPESMWEEWLKDNCVQDLGRSEISYIQERVKGMYESIVEERDKVDELSERLSIAPMNSTPIATVIDHWTRGFSRVDGLTNFIVRSAIEAYGAMASFSALVNFPNDHWRQDAFRHYAWNFSSAGSIEVGITAAGRMNSTRIFTTNREWVVMFFHFNPRYRVTNPSDEQIAIGINWRNRHLNFDFGLWNTRFLEAGSIGRETLMDLWNNEMGRQDASLHGAVLTRFNARWNNNTLIRSDSAADVTLARRQQIFNNAWDMPVR